MTKKIYKILRRRRRNPDFLYFLKILFFISCLTFQHTHGGGGIEEKKYAYTEKKKKWKKRKNRKKSNQSRPLQFAQLIEFPEVGK